MTFVITRSAVKTDGLSTFQAVEVQALAVICACALLLGNGLFALLEIFNVLQGRRRVLADSERRLLVRFEAVMTQEQVAPLAVVRSIVTRTL